MPLTRVRIAFTGLILTAAATGCAFDAVPALAQDAAQDSYQSPTAAPPPVTSPDSLPSRRRPVQPARATETRPAGAFGETSAAPDVPSPLPNDPNDDPGAMPQEPDDGTDSPQPREGQRAVPKDGDLSEATAQPMLRDGIIDVNEPPPVVDGVDPTTVDSRAKEESDLFENPRSTYDELVFQIEDLNPILDKRPARLFKFEPYDPVGIKMGSFVLFPEAEFGFNAYSNVLRSPNARQDISFDVRPSARLVSNWTRHALEFNAKGGFSFYDEQTTENEKSYQLEVRGRLDISKRTNIQASLSRELAQESRSDLEARNAGTRADVTTDTATAALNHRFNRLSLQLRGSVTDRSYGESVTGGVEVQNDTRDYTTYEEAVRASWEFKPTLSVFSEVAVNQREYARVDSTGVERNSTGERYRAGLSFGNTGEYLRGEIAVGWGVQRPSSAQLSEVSGVIVDANLTYKATPLTSFMLNARSDFGETTNTGVGAVRAQVVGVEARHAFRRDLIATAGLQYTWSDYVGSTLKEDELRATLGAEYYLNRETVLFTRYAHSAFTSNAANASYDSDEFRVGFKIRR